MPIKVLCFHGYATNNEFMKHQMRHLKYLEQRGIQFVFINGMYPINKNQILNEDLLKKIEGQIYSWFELLQSKQALCNYIYDFIKKNGPIQGLLGFSQGTVAVQLFLQNYQKKCYPELSIQFVILVSANMPYVYEKNFSLFRIPSFHIISPQDFIFKNSIIVTARFLNARVIEHEQGHKFPRMSLTQLRKMQSFIRNSLNKSKL